MIQRIQNAVFVKTKNKQQRTNTERSDMNFVRSSVETQKKNVIRLMFPISACDPRLGWCDFGETICYWYNHFCSHSLNVHKKYHFCVVLPCSSPWRKLRESNQWNWTKARTVAFLCCILISSIFFSWSLMHQLLKFGPFLNKYLHVFRILTTTKSILTLLFLFGVQRLFNCFGCKASCLIIENYLFVA